MKRFFSYLMVMATLVLGGGKAMAQSVTIDGVVYSVNGDHAYVSGNDGTVTDVIIPDVVNISGQDYPVTEIGTNAFMYCSSMTSLVLPENLTSIASCALYECTSLTELRIPSKVTSIGWNALVGMKSLKLIELNFEYIPGMEVLFSDMEGRAIDLICHSTVVPEILCTERYSPNSHGGGGLVPTNTILYVPKGMYYSYLEKYPNHKIIDIVEGEDFVFDTYVEDCIRYANTGAVELTDKTLTEYTIKEGTTLLAAGLFSNCTNMTNISIPSSVVSIGTNTFYGCSALTSLVLPETVTSIGPQAFYNCSSLTSVNIPSGVTSIGDNTFYGCSALASLTLPETVASIGKSAFDGCSSIEVISIPSKVKYVELCTFKDCSSLVSVSLPNSLLEIRHQAFWNCTKLKSIDIPNGVVYIYGEAFRGCSSLATLALPESVGYIGGMAFGGCYSLKSINIPLGLTNIENDTFSGCSSLTSLTLPNGLLSIGESAFSNCSALVSLTLPENLTSIANRAFYYCSSLSSIDIPSNVTAIGDYAFYGCSSLSSVNFPNGLLSIGCEAFRGCALTSLNFPKGLTSIGEYAFSYCPSLESVTIPEGFTTLNDYVFYECPAMRTFEWPSTLQHIGYSNIGGNALEIVSHATTPPFIGSWPGGVIVMYVPEECSAAYKEQHPDWIIIEGTGSSVAVDIITQGTLGEEVLKQVNYLNEVNHLTISGVINDTDINTIRNSMPNLVSVDLSEVNMESVPANFLYEKRALSKVILPNNAKVIGSEAFRYCSRLRDVVLPSSLERIDYAVFFESGIETIEIPTGVTMIGNSAFDDCYYLKTVNIPIGIKRLEERVFSSCKSLNTITLPDSITYIGSYAFEGCSSLTSIELPKELTRIDREAFARCTRLDTIYFPEKLTSIGYCAFYECTSLKHLTIPSSVLTLDDGAFHSCRGLLDAFILDGVTYIGHHAFNGCYNLSEVTLPSTLRECSYEIFIACSKLSKVTCNAFFPPAVGEIVPNNTCTLYVPELTLNRYKLANNWSLFSKIEPISGIYPANISVYKEESLTIPDTGLPQDYKPNMTMETLYTNSWTYNTGKLTVIGNNPLPLSTFEMQQRRDVGAMSSLVNHGTITADNVVTELTISTGTWHFLSFPYDVKISDIATVNDWVISRYDGAARAKEDFGNTWKTLPYDSILHAGEGYIWHSQGGNFTVPAMDNENKNLIFANDTRYIQLKENPAATEANYGWNLIGNPYPCYYDTRYMQFSSPITVRSGDSYAAYSPVDDSYILSPLEAFFVQCSAENNIVSFDTEGRQTDNSVRTLSYAPARTRAMGNERSVLNLYLESNAYADHTRLVVNEDASLAYEIACDAAKFMSDDAAVSQLFTIEGGERMAINERPLANGKAVLGVYIGKAGSYTLSIDTKAMDTEVFLVDKLLGTETDLTTSSYAFTAEAGTFTDRFEIRLKRTGVVDGIEAVTAELKVEATADGISVSNATTPIYIYSATGALVDAKVGSDVTFDVPQGVYVVKVGDNVHKVVVK